ncbi:MAG TPA: hypothetical protein VGH28_15350 [Polyangiaceae bacterium]|jgi:hypothetical protein
MRGRLIFAGLVLVGALGAGAACGLDENGGSVDASTDVRADAPGDAPVDVVQGCSTIDASACVDAALPPGWTWSVVALADQACPPGDYKTSKYSYDLGLEAGACTCTCTTSGSFTCAGTIFAGSGGGGSACKQNVIMFDAGDDASCIDTGWNDPHIGFSAPVVSGTPTCTAVDGGTGAWTAKTATACAPGCSVDYCGANAGGFSRCIIASGSETCPPPFTPQPTMGPADQVGVQCGACGCTVAPPADCTATAYGSMATDCSNAYNVPVAPLTCPTPGGAGKVNSFLYVPTVPPVTCAADGGSGSALFENTVTVCCLP